MGRDSFDVRCILGSKNDSRQQQLAGDSFGFSLHLGSKNNSRQQHFQKPPYDKQVVNLSIIYHNRVMFF